MAIIIYIFFVFFFKQLGKLEINLTKPIFKKTIKKQKQKLKKGFKKRLKYS